MKGKKGKIMARTLPKPKIGRPAKPYPLRYNLRHDADQMDLTARSGRWIAAAARASMEVGDWIRLVCDGAAKGKR